MADKAVSKNDDANAIVDDLRRAAQRIVELGDALEEMAAERDDLQEQIDELLITGDSSESDDMLKSWRETIEDFARGLLDKDELLENTVRLRDYTT